MSLAVNVAMQLVRDAARLLKNVPEGVDVEIIERHHRFKEDAPSGTALKFGEIVAHEMGQDRHIHGREGRTGQRPRNEIAYHALRVGDNVLLVQQRVYRWESGWLATGENTHLCALCSGGYTSSFIRRFGMSEYADLVSLGAPS